MIKKNDFGLYYETINGKKYSLYIGECIKADYSSDILFIMDDDDENSEPKFVNWLYGASVLEDETLGFYDDFVQIISKTINEYESK